VMPQSKKRFLNHGLLCFKILQIVINPLTNYFLWGCCKLRSVGIMFQQRLHLFQPFPFEHVLKSFFKQTSNGWTVLVQPPGIITVSTLFTRDNSRNSGGWWAEKESSIRRDLFLCV
jgi:hypothetical protein